MIQKSSVKITLACLALLGAASSLSGCGGTSASVQDNSPSLASTAAPVALTPARDTASSGALTGPVNEGELRKAVDRYRVTKQRNISQYDHVGADLNGDGRPEALVLFSGEDWCVKTGCSLVVFQEEPSGYKPVSHITRVRPPLMIGPDANFGWRDLIVKTGGGSAPVRTVRLGFTGKGYPINALLQPEPVREMLAQSQQIMAASPAFTAALNQQQSQPVAR